MVDAALFEEIQSLQTLSPSPKTNEAFSKLVAFCLTAQEKDITLEADEISTLQKLSSKAESEMELHWAHKIITSEDPKQELLAFWYYKNYCELTNLEYTHMSLITDKLKKIVFLGGGPLPLTPILLCQKYGIACTVLEKDMRSGEIASRLITALGLEDNISIQTIDGAEYTDYDRHDLVYIAALVGEDEQRKNAIISTVYTRMKQDSFLLCRHAHGARKLLYPSISDATLKTMKPILEIKPSDSVINSFIVLQKT